MTTPLNSQNSSLIRSQEAYRLKFISLNKIAINLRKAWPIFASLSWLTRCSIANITAWASSTSHACWCVVTTHTFIYFLLWRWRGVGSAMCSIKCKLKTVLHLPGKQGFAYWQVTLKFWGSWQPAQFSMSDWRRRMSPCWLAMSCCNFFINAIKSLMPRSKFSKRRILIKIQAQLSSIFTYHHSHHA